MNTAKIADKLVTNFLANNDQNMLLTATNQNLVTCTQSKRIKLILVPKCKQILTQ